MLGRPAIASMSLGRPGVHFLPRKLRIAAKYGFQGIEIFFEDLEKYARTLGIPLFHAARNIRGLCDLLRLRVVCLQPLLFYEGLRDRTEHSRQINERLPIWFKVATLLGTDLILVPSNFLAHDSTTGESRTTGDVDVIVNDLQELADRGFQHSPPLRFGYESIAWANHIDTWEAGWDIVCRVDRANFGICIDTFNIAARVYADPASPSSKTLHADEDFDLSIKRLRSTLNPEKIFFLQVADGERLSTPLLEGHEFHVPGQPSRMNWSRNARLFPLEHNRGAYLPITEIAAAICDLGFSGPTSLEVFSRTLADQSVETPEEHARRGIESWSKLAQAVEAYAAFKNTSRSGDFSDLDHASTTVMAAALPADSIRKVAHNSPITASL